MYKLPIAAILCVIHACVRRTMRFISQQNEDNTMLLAHRLLYTPENHVVYMYMIYRCKQRARRNNWRFSFVISTRVCECARSLLYVLMWKIIYNLFVICTYHIVPGCWRTWQGDDVCLAAVVHLDLPGCVGSNWGAKPQNVVHFSSMWSCSGFLRNLAFGSKVHLSWSWVQKRPRV